MPFLEVNGIEIYYERFGQGAPLLNISGSGGDLRLSHPDLSPLNRHFDVVHYDQRGVGQSSKPDIDYTMSDYANDAAAMIKAMGWDWAYVMGTSFGGMVATNLAIHHSHLVRRLVLNCTSPGGLLPSFPLHELKKLDVEAQLELRLGLLDNRWDPGADDPIPGLGAIYDILIEQSRQPKTAEQLAGEARQLAARAGHDVAKQLHHIESPTLVCAGEYDDLAPVRNSEALADGIPNAELAVFQGGHLFLLQDRDAMKRIIEFLQG